MTQSKGSFPRFTKKQIGLLIAAVLMNSICGAQENEAEKGVRYIRVPAQHLEK